MFVQSCRKLCRQGRLQPQDFLLGIKEPESLPRETVDTAVTPSCSLYKQWSLWLCLEGLVSSGLTLACPCTNRFILVLLLSHPLQAGWLSCCFGSVCVLSHAGLYKGWRMFCNHCLVCAVLPTALGTSLQLKPAFSPVSLIVSCFVIMLLSQMQC